MANNLGYIVNELSNVYYITDSIKVDKLKSGCYAIDVDQNNSVHLRKIEVDSNHVISLPNLQLQSLLDESTKFWKEAEKYEKYKLPHKRGFLLHGPPGSGKTTVVIKLSEYIVNFGGVVIFCDYFDDSVRVQLTKIREIEPDRPIAIVLEQLESMLLDEHGQLNSDLLNFLDGIHGIEHALFIATTNDFNCIPDSIKKRPSRFDLKIEIKLPDDIDREHYLKKMIPSTEFKKIDLPTWIKDTNGYTISHLKELITSYFIYGYDYKTIITNINKLIKISKEVGFNK